MAFLRHCGQCHAQSATFWRPPMAARKHCKSCLAAVPISASASSAGPPELPEVAQLSSRVSRVLGRNPSPFSLTGTNMYLVGTGPRRILIDAGEGKPGVLQDLVSLMQANGVESLEQIIITHWHHDHLMGLPELLNYFGSVPVRKYLPSEGTAFQETGPTMMGGTFDPNEFLEGTQIVGLQDGEVLRCDGAALRVMFTPGHANDHVSLLLEEERALFTGDNVLGWGTGVFRDLQQYMQSLKKMQGEQPELLYPAHGPVVERGHAGPWLQMYISHREQRIEQVVKALHESGSEGLNVEELTRNVYRTQPNVLESPWLLAGATSNSKLVLEYLVKDNKCLEKDGKYILIASRL